MKVKDRVQSWLKSSLNDPIVKILLKNNTLTKIQLETLLIDVLSENFTGKSLRYEEKADFRLLKAKISRGAFNRTLRQAKNNVIKAIYTILLLGYIGIFESTTLDLYLETSNKLQEYVDMYKKMVENEHDKEALNFLFMVRKELEMSLKKLSTPSRGLM
jgi:hypothetical protein